MDWILARLREPSTYAGIGVLLGLIGFHIPDATVAAGSQALMALAAFVSIILKDKAP